MNETGFKHPAVLAAIISLVGIVAAVAIFSSAYSSRTPRGTITVTGSAQKVITSNVAVWSSSFSRTVGPEGLKSGNALIKSDTAAVEKYLASKGISPSEISFQPVSVSPNYNYINSKEGGGQQVFTGYTLSQTVTVNSSNIDKVAGIASNSGTLLDQGILFQSNPPQYLYNGLADLKIQMINDASRDALARASKVAENSKAGLGPLKSASIGVIQITPEFSSELSAEGSYDTSSIRKTVTVVVHASYEVSK